MEEQLTSAFLVSMEIAYFGFMFTTYVHNLDLTGNADGDVDSSGSSSIGSLFGMAIFGCVISSSILASGQFPREIQIVLISVIHHWFGSVFCSPLSWTSPTNLQFQWLGQKIHGHSLKFHL